MAAASTSAEDLASAEYVASLTGLLLTHPESPGEDHSSGESSQRTSAEGVGSATVATEVLRAGSFSEGSADESIGKFSPRNRSSSSGRSLLRKKNVRSSVDVTGSGFQNKLKSKLKLGKFDDGKDSSNLNNHLASLLNEDDEDSEGEEAAPRTAANEEFAWQTPVESRCGWDAVDSPDPDPRSVALLNSEACAKAGWRTEFGNPSYTRSADDDLECELEDVHRDLPYYLTYFSKSKVKHTNLLCEDQTYGPLCVTYENTGTGPWLYLDAQLPDSLKVDGQANLPCKAILRTKNGLERFVIPAADCASARDKLRYIRSMNDKWSKLKFVEIADPALIPKLEEFERQYMVAKYKFGVLLAQCDQTDENDMFSNQKHQVSENFESFLDLLGERVVLKGFKKFRGGLNIRDDSTGTHSIYTSIDMKGRDIDYKGPEESKDDLDTSTGAPKLSAHVNSQAAAAYQDGKLVREVMFHVSTLLPYQENDLQRVERKRHLGNDIVVIVFRDAPPEGSDRKMTSFDPACVASQFNNVFVCISVDPETTKSTGETHYSVAIALKGGAVPFTPFLPSPPVFKHGPEFRRFLLTKLVNAERACLFHAPDFKLKMQRTAKALLCAMCEDFISNAQKRNREIERAQQKASLSMDISGPSGFEVRGSGVDALRQSDQLPSAAATQPQALQGREKKFAHLSLEDIASKISEGERSVAALERLVLMYSADARGRQEAEEKFSDAQADLAALKVVQKLKKELEAAMATTTDLSTPTSGMFARPLSALPALPPSATKRDAEESALAVYRNGSPTRKAVAAPASTPTTEAAKPKHKSKTAVQIPKHVIDGVRAESRKREAERER